MKAISEMIEAHRELVEVGRDHDEAHDSFTENDSNFIKDEEGLWQCKTGDISNREDCLTKLCVVQQEAIQKSHEAFSKFASDFEDNNPTGPNRTTRIAEGQIKAFFDEFGSC